jgi:hypothetical protein
MNWVTAWARHPASGLYSLEDWSWIWTYWVPNNIRGVYKLTEAGIGVFIAGNLARKYLSFNRSYTTIICAGMLFALAALIAWFVKAPTWRLGIGPLMIAAPMITLYVFGVSREGNNNFWRNASFVLMGGLILKFGVFNRITDNDPLNFDGLKVGTPQVKSSNNFGVQPIEGDQCWVVKDCSPYERNSPSSWMGYRIFESK